jgi:hypothetical protein
MMRQARPPLLDLLQRFLQLVSTAVKTEQVRDVVVQYLNAHPEKRHEPAAARTLIALQAAFPCK